MSTRGALASEANSYLDRDLDPAKFSFVDKFEHGGHGGDLEKRILEIRYDGKLVATESFGATLPGLPNRSRDANKIDAQSKAALYRAQIKAALDQGKKVRMSKSSTKGYHWIASTSEADASTKDLLEAMKAEIEALRAEVQALKDRPCTIDKNAINRALDERKIQERKQQDFMIQHGP